MSKALVKNAADENQVKSARNKTDREREQQIADLKFLLSTAQGRRYLWRLLEHCHVFGSIWRPSAEIHHLSGKQDVGHFVLAEITEANADSFLTMMKEAKERKENGQ